MEINKSQQKKKKNNAYSLLHCIAVLSCRILSQFQREFEFKLIGSAILHIFTQKSGLLNLVILGKCA